jgi:hypothetical protein
MSQPSESNSRSRILLLVPVAVLGVLSIIATGGGGGGDNGNGGGNGNGNGEVPPTILTSYNFEIGSVVPQSQGGLEVEANEFTVTIDFGDTILGSVNLDVGTNSQVTFLSYVVHEGSDFSITVSRTQTALDGTFTVEMTADLNTDLDAEPTSGTFDVVAGDETATVNVVANGVELSLNGGAATFYTWDDYDNILDDPMAEAWQQRAALAGGAMQFIFEQMFAVADQLDELEASVEGPIATSCDMFDGTPPDGVLGQGENVLTWLGATSADSMLGSIFDWEFTDCWTSDNDQLANGLIQFQNYIEEVNASNVLVRIGFGPTADMDGGIVFVGWTLSDTSDDQGVYTIDHSGDLTIRGGFSLMFEAM